MTPAEERAAREGFPVVLLTNFELLRICAGNPMVTSTLDGNEVLVRIPTADELLDIHVASCRKYSVEPSMTRAQAESLTQPIGVQS
jgi:hypothetical protein